MRAGARPEAALAPLGAAPGGGLIAGAVALNAELGGDLVTALRALGDGLADRDRLRRELAASTAQARFAGRVVPVVPLAALALLWLMSPASVRPLLTTSIGLAVCATSAGLTLAALVAMRRILAGAEP
jgi:tight adherence protein B